MAKKEEQEYTRVEKSILPLKYVDLIEDVFHGILALSLLGIGIGAFYFSIERIFTTAPFFPNGMIQGINDILFIVIILEILRTVISRFTDGVYQLDKFLIIGVIAAFDTFSFFKLAYFRLARLALIIACSNLASTSQSIGN